ncbi:hypothetical protein [Leifsonia shinshuensis]|uniref:hypothetical protein n=1 Tax=Leifsonia TaxID=110932 RepID=UPI002857CB1C|nr:hypothetical protein [Leifsonia shinshuensis]MDR6970772.1 hypothetical protein [Leifsonia shinshuensis]
MALYALTLTGCTQARMCGEEITPAPRITVDVHSWVTAHPETNVRVCAEGSCLTGYNVVAFTMDEPSTLPHDGDSMALTAEAVQGTDAVQSFRTTARLVHNQCGQEGLWLRMDASGRFSTTSPQ